MVCEHNWLTLKPLSLRLQKSFSWVLCWVFYFLNSDLNPRSKTPQQNLPLPSCGVKDRADAKWRGKKSLFWQQAKGRRAVRGVGQPQAPSHNGHSVLGDKSISTDTSKPRQQGGHIQMEGTTAHLVPHFANQPTKAKFFAAGRRAGWGPRFEVPPLRSAFMWKGKGLSVGQAAPTGSLCCRMPAHINNPGAWRRSVR